MLGKKTEILEGFILELLMGRRFGTDFFSGRLAFSHRTEGTGIWRLLESMAGGLRCHLHRESLAHIQVGRRRQSGIFFTKYYHDSNSLVPSEETIPMTSLHSFLPSVSNPPHAFWP